MMYVLFLSDLSSLFTMFFIIGITTNSFYASCRRIGNDRSKPIYRGR